jgi:hypothetical protein
MQGPRLDNGPISFWGRSLASITSGSVIVDEIRVVENFKASIKDHSPYAAAVFLTHCKLNRVLQLCCTGLSALFAHFRRKDRGVRVSLTWKAAVCGDRALIMLALTRMRKQRYMHTSHGRAKQNATKTMRQLEKSRPFCAQRTAMRKNYRKLLRLT